MGCLQECTHPAALAPRCRGRPLQQPTLPRALQRRMLRLFRPTKKKKPAVVATTNQRSTPQQRCGNCLTNSRHRSPRTSNRSGAASAGRWRPPSGTWLLPRVLTIAPQHAAQTPRRAPRQWRRFPLPPPWVPPQLPLQQAFPLPAPSPPTSSVRFRTTVSLRPLPRPRLRVSFGAITMRRWHYRTWPASSESSAPPFAPPSTGGAAALSLEVTWGLLASG